VLLGALCLFLSTLEYLIPKPLPFIRIGLANLPLLLALDLLSPRHFALLTLIKITGGGIVGGGIFSYGFLFSLGGSAASSLVMYGLGLVRRKGGALRPGLAGISAAGALCSTGVQLFLARFLVFGEGARYLIPPFLAAALVTGFALGLFCEYFRGRSRWYALRSGGAVESAAEPRVPGPAVQSADPSEREPPRRLEPGRQKRRDRWALFDRRDLVSAGFLGALLFLFNPSTPGRGGQFLFFWFCAWASGRKSRPLVTLSVIAGIVLVNLLAPYGRVLTEIGPLSVTTGSLAMGLRRGITLEGLFMLSAALVPGKVRRGQPSGQAAAKAAKAGPGGLRRGFRAFLGLLEESLAVFAILSDGEGIVRPGRFTGDLDKLFLDLEALPVSQMPEGGALPPPGEGPRRARGRPLLVLGLLITAVFTVVPVILGQTH
jgi:heptaprenyl diphosphate synthase